MRIQVIYIYGIEGITQNAIVAGFHKIIWYNNGNGSEIENFSELGCCKPTWFLMHVNDEAKLGQYRSNEVYCSGVQK